ncbi:MULTISPECIES: hypothetical protein [Streptomyces]|uniref:Uncharacterized protein n=1 Tax=Streptomyces venezuelae TaxID=54571 RepID=A0A5P2AYZ6_STRVZ|nr:hypothetical protein [Streptomyces venezuelae]QES20436.1 hypothetical protein DEJ46_16000 [Streptomyces venezuelae]QES23484.1 hypothetical protein DEJ46_33755 [Streptomyces venezuelae]
MSPLTLADLSAPLMTLRMLGAEFPHLPAPCVTVSTVYPERLELSFHDDFAGFEAWREALNIAPESVVHRVQVGGQTGVLRVRATFAGAELELTGYAKVPALEPVLSGAGAVS